MRMTIEMNATMVRLIPNSLPIVEEAKHLPVNFNFSIVLHAANLAHLHYLFIVLVNHFIMIAEDEVDTSVELSKNVFELGKLHESKVTQMPNGILRTHHSIPILDELEVHVHDILEGTLRILNDIRMPPMSV